uniref:Uncharacterized protein n=1 Tax=Anguilla anguilla TaxID=7936 RepID=A0A0E9XHJ1_ANGAN
MCSRAPDGLQRAPRNVSAWTTVVVYVRVNPICGSIWPTSPRSLSSCVQAHS